MAKYLGQISYSVEGAKGLLKEGGTKRLKAVEQLAKELSAPTSSAQSPVPMSFCSMEALEHMVKGVGGTLESFYYAFGEFDLVVIVDLPDNASAAALSLTISSSGASKIKTTVLLTPEEIDQASKMSIHYRPPGQ
ncbi:MAG: GYD domain-containing protein [Desulfuromonadales bacterium]